MKFMSDVTFPLCPGKYHRSAILILQKQWQIYLLLANLIKNGCKSLYLHPTSQIYISCQFPSTVLTKHVFPDDVEGLFIELNFRKGKWLLFGTYHPPTQSDSYYFNNLDKTLDLYSRCDKKLLVGDFNAQISDVLSIFLYQHDLENHAKDKTSFKITNNPSIIDIFWLIILLLSKTRQQHLLVFLIAIN